MRANGRILIVEDDPLWVETYKSVLDREDFEVTAAPDGPRVRELLEHDADWDVIILDLKLRGREGPNDGLDLIAELRLRAPFAKVIMVTAFAERQPILDAFRAGVYDFLEKPGRQHAVLLQSKVRNAWELVRERRMAALGTEAHESAIQTTYQGVLSEPDRHKKGRLLEQLMVLLFRSIPGFGGVDPDRRNDIEQIDFFIPNEAQDPLWQKEGSVFLGECKNWSQPVGSQEFVVFREKLRRRFGRCRLGFLVAPGGFAETVAEMQRAYSVEDLIIILIGAEELAALVQSGDRNKTLKELYHKTLFAMNGKATSRRT